MIQILKQMVFSLQPFNITLRVCGVPLTTVLLTFKSHNLFWLGYASLMIHLVDTKKKKMKAFRISFIIFM